MRWLFVGLVALHALIHLMGFAKAFSYAELPQLTQPISKGAGLVWLAAAFNLFVAAGLFFWTPRTWWLVGLLAVALSQVAIVSAWGDAKFGTIANALILLGVVYGFASQGPFSLRSEYRRAVGARLARPLAPPPVTEADLTPLPAPLQRYVRQSGAVGRAQVHRFRAVWRGRIRAGPDDPWMPFTAEQTNFLDEPARFFLMQARKGGLPVDVLHAFGGDSASMQVRLLSAIPMVNAGGPDARRAETVTLFNDLCILAPAALVDPAIRWESLDERSARGYYAVGSDTVSAVLIFNEDGELVDFVSDDRLAASPDGTTFVRRRWSTPLGDYRDFEGRRVATRGEGRWHPAEMEFVYLEMELLELEVNGGR